MMLGFASTPLVPTLFVLGGGIVLTLIAPLLCGGRESKIALSVLNAVVLIACGLSLWLWGGAIDPDVLFFMDRQGLMFSSAIVALGLLVTPALVQCKGINSYSGAFALLQIATMGAVVLVFGNSWLMLFLGLELLSIPLYVFVAFGQQRALSAEAAFKYFLLGVMASALFVYGTALIWGMTGSTGISSLVQGMRSSQEGWFLTLGMCMLITSLAFKMGMVPFHFWVPDVYQSAPAPIVAWMSGVVKLTVLCVLLRLFGVFFVTEQWAWSATLWLLGGCSMLIGSLSALMQTNLKRLFGFSTVAHTGFLCLGLLAYMHGGGAEALSCVFFYAVVYALASYLGFMVISLEEEQGRTELSDYSGLYHRSPMLALFLGLSVLSLAGLPPLSGFWAKYSVIVAAITTSNVGLVLVAIVTTVISLGYYLRILLVVFIRPSSRVASSTVNGFVWLTLLVAGLSVVYFGVFPQNLFSLIE